MSPDTKHVERIELPVAASEATISADGKSIAFIAMDPDAHSTRLFLWNPGQPQLPARKIGENLGYYADPRFSPDGAWVYFVHNPNGRGRPTQHLGQAFAQLYRIRANDSGLEALSDTKGCHYAPTPLADGRLYYAHTSCHRTARWLETTSPTKPEALTLATETDLEDLTVSPDGRRAAWLTRNVETASVDSMNLVTRKKRTLFRLARRPASLQLVWVTPSRLLFLEAGVIKRWESGKPVDVFRVGGGQ